MCSCLRVYAYLVDCLNQRALLDQHSHRFHVTILTRIHQRCATVLPSQPASVRRSGAAAAPMRVHARVPMHYVRDSSDVRVFMCSTGLD